MPRLQSSGLPSPTASRTLDREAASPAGETRSSLASKMVAVIVVTHGEYTAQYLGPCYASLARQTYPADRLRLFVVDNGATERSRPLIAALAPGATVVERRRNAGWGPGNNAGIRVALQQGYEYIVLVNVDTVLDPLWLARLVEAAQAQPNLHMLQSLILFEGTTRVQSFGNRIHFLGYGYCNGYGLDAARLTGSPAMDYASGAALLVKRQVFEAIGLFRHDYFLCYDDMEFGWRARLAGFNVGLVRGSICYHKYEFSSRLSRLYYYQRNRLQTWLALLKLRTILVTAPCWIMSELALSGYLVATGRIAVQWQVVTYFLRAGTWRKIQRQRRLVRTLRKRPDADIVRHFASQIVFPEINGFLLHHICNPLLGLYWTAARRLIRW